MSSNANNDGALEERTDLSAETSSLLESLKSTPSSSVDLATSLTLLQTHEKKCRLANDTPSLIRICTTCLQLCHDSGNNERLIETLKMLCGRRSQKSKAIGAMVQLGVGWVLKDPTGCELADVDSSKGETEEGREALVVALRDITDGKIFLEAERARLTRCLAVIKEQNGDVSSAASILQEVHVETYGSLSKREKIEFLLEQMRLTLAKKDYVRAYIVGNKINRKALGEEGMENFKVTFYKLMAEYHRHEKDAYELSKDYHAIYTTQLTMDRARSDSNSSSEDVDMTDFSAKDRGEPKWMSALRSTVLYLALSPHTREQNDTLNRISTDTNLEKIDACRETVNILLRKEIASYPLPHQEEEMESWDAFTTASDDGEDMAEYWRKILRKRIIQHNVRVAALYYRRIRGKRLAELLGLQHEELESEVADMVSNGEVYAKIDRPNNIIRFQEKKSPETVLSNWAGDVSSLLHLVETTSNLIQKENMTQ